jgi:hypothetical protein
VGAKQKKVGLNSEIFSGKTGELRESPDFIGEKHSKKFSKNSCFKIRS